MPPPPPPSAAADRPPPVGDTDPPTADSPTPPTPPDPRNKSPPLPVEPADDFAAHLSPQDVDDDDDDDDDEPAPAAEPDPAPPPHPDPDPAPARAADPAPPPPAAPAPDPPAEILPPVSAPTTQPAPVSVRPDPDHPARPPAATAAAAAAAAAAATATAAAAAAATAAPPAMQQDLPPPPPAQPPPPPAPSRRGRRNSRNSRIGRPPNINENSLMRRLECVMAVDSGRMTMLTACQQYDISARTFYRWLRNKDRLIELTGFTEEDFRANPPWGPAPGEQPAAPPDPHAPPDDMDTTQNLPRLPPQASKPGASPVGPPAPGYMGMKRRFPKSTTPAASANHAPFHGSAVGDDRFQNTSQATFYARRAFTKMPSQTATAADPVSADRQAARASTRMRRQEWAADPAGAAASGAAPVGGAQYRRDDPRFPQPVPVDGSRSNSPNEPLKRRKIMRAEHPHGEGADEAGTGSGGTPTGAARDAQAPESPENGGGADYANGATGFPQQRLEADATRAAANGRSGGEADDQMNGRHRIEIMMGRRKVTIAWYHGASAEDIKSSIARRFALLPGTQWALIDKNFDEIVISAGVPSGRYTLTVFS